ncbi:MAG: DUF6262 family protein [Oculatellaceae cyanobacterium bins.114]|nr:DUF6262 family protein [Oculatellaceae cyanobacterium bins.114]
MKLGCSRAITDRTLTHLFERGEIRLGCDRFSSKVHPEIRAWAIDYEPGVRDSKLFRAAKPPEPCKTYFDPSLISATPPQRNSVAKPKPSPTKPAMTQPEPIIDRLSQFDVATEPQLSHKAKSTADEIRKRVIEAIAALEKSGAKITLETIRKKAGVGRGVFYEAEFSDLKYRADHAIAQYRERIKTEAETKSATPPTPVAETKETEVWALRQKIAELEHRCRELESTKPSADEKTAILKRIENHISTLRATLKRLEESRKQLDADEKACLLKLHALHELYELETGDRPPVDLEMVVANPSNGNGKHAIAVGGAA